MYVLGWKAKVIGATALAIVAFYAGWKVCSWHQSARHMKEIDKIIAIKQADDKKNRDLIAELQATKQKVITKEVIRYAKIKDITDNRVCFANWDAVRLWNDALSGQESVPKDTTGATAASDGPSVTDADILRNINTNAARWEQLRDQMNKIIEWDKQTFGTSE